MKNLFICVKKSKIIAIFVCFAIIFLHFILYFNVLGYKNVVDTLSHKVFNSFSHKKNDSESNNSDDDIYFVLIKQNIKPSFSQINAEKNYKLKYKISYKLKSEQSFNKNKFSISKLNKFNSSIFNLKSSLKNLKNGLKINLKNYEKNLNNCKINLKNAKNNSKYCEKYTFKIEKNGNKLEFFCIKNGEI